MCPWWKLWKDLITICDSSFWTNCSFLTFPRILSLPTTIDYDCRAWRGKTRVSTCVSSPSTHHPLCGQDLGSFAQVWTFLKVLRNWWPFYLQFCLFEICKYQNSIFPHFPSLICVFLHFFAFNSLIKSHFSVAQDFLGIRGTLVEQIYLIYCGKPVL